MKRNIYSELIKWKENPAHKPLGSRGQVPVTHMATQWEGLEEVPGMPDVNSL